MVLYFTAAWCGPCRMFKPVMEQVSSALGIQVNYIDVDTNPDLTQQYAVSSVPTVVVVNNGNAVYRNTGVMSKPQLTQVLSQFR